jgi:RsiW-degrading membrane proteinase PrsW (M82 family)
MTTTRAGQGFYQPSRVARMLWPILVVGTVLALALLFLWPPVLAILLLAGHPIMWAIFAVVTVVLIVVVLRRERADKHDAGRS